MEQSFVLQYYGHVSLADIRFLTAEERSWYINRIVKEKKDKAEAEEKAMRRK